MRPNMRVISVFFGLAGALVWAGAANGQPLPFAKQDSQLAAVPAPHISRPSISDLRVGLHPDKTRVVLDLSQPVGYTHQVSQDGTAVFIDLAEVKWRARPATARHHKGLVTEFKFAPTGKRGGRLSILAASPVSQAKSFLIPPSGKRGYRLVLDLVARKSAKPVNAFRPAKLRLPAARRINGQAGQLHLAVYKPHKPFGGDQTTPIKVRTQARPVPLSRTNGQYAQSPRSHPQPRPRAPRPPAASSNPYLKAIEKREHEMAPAADDGGGLFGIPGMYG
ncbi:MAG: AMIN domain-containing protein, partial [Rhodospirillales bacterium]|nr:AMIN domain-containing protein [Rhodospirillales bacterium]